MIDGLDESATDERSEMMKLIADYFPDLPKCVKVFVTSRPELFLRELDHIQTMEIDANHKENKLDLLEYLKVYLPSLVRVDSYHSFPPILTIRIVVDKCEGSFMYAYHIQRELRKRKDLDTMMSVDMAFLPKGIGSVYESYFRRLEMELEAVLSRKTELFKLLELVVAAEGPVPLTFLARALDLASDCREMRRIIKKVNEAVSCLLCVSSDDLVNVFHRSVYDWLCMSKVDTHEYTVEIFKGKKRLWLYCKEIFEEIKKTVTSGCEPELTSEVKHALKFEYRYIFACDIEDDFSWLVDMIVVHVVLTVYPKTTVYLRDEMYIVHQSDVGLSFQQRQKISWHLVEIFRLNMDPCFSYLHCVLNCSPADCFSEKEKETAKMLLTKSFRCLQATSFRTKTANLIQARVFRFRDIQAASVSSNKKVAALAFKDGMICVLSLPELVILWQYSTKHEGISCCTFSPDDSFILFGKLDTVLNIAEKKEVFFFAGVEERFKSCAFSANGNRLITTDGSSTVMLWDVVRQSLLSVLCAGFPVGVCSFSNSGLFIIGDQRNAKEVAYCVWNAITLQRVDQRSFRLPHKAHSEICNRCVWPQRKELIPSKELAITASLQLNLFEYRASKEVVYNKLSTGVYCGEDCIFYLGRHSLCVIECTHFTSIDAWETYINNTWVNYADPSKHHTIVCCTPFKDDCWLYADATKVVVLSTVPQEDQPCPSPATRVLWCTFSPDETRLATCTSDGFINLWNINKCNVYQRFRSDIGTSSAACWWSSGYLFVCHVTGQIPILSKYLVEENYKITITQGQPTSLMTFPVNECLPVSDVVDFSEGCLSFIRGWNKPGIFLNVNKTGNPKIVDLPGLRPMMRIAVSAGATFVLGTNLEFLFWKQSENNPAVYNIFCHFVICNPSPFIDSYFSSDSKSVVSFMPNRFLL